MIIFNESGEVIVNPDLNLGYLKTAKKKITHYCVVDSEEEGHYDVVAEYPNGGKDLEWVVDKERIFHTETRDENGEIVEFYDGKMENPDPTFPIPDEWSYQVYILYTEEELEEKKRQEEESKHQMAVAGQTSIAMQMMVLRMNLSDDEALMVEALYPEWVPESHRYTKDDICRYNNNLYRCLSNHTSQASWTPETAHSLWVRIRPEGEIPEWEQVQPGINEPYKKGDKVTHNGFTWVSDIDNNVWEPGVYGWTKI